MQLHPSVADLYQEKWQYVSPKGACVSGCNDIDSLYPKIPMRLTSLVDYDLLYYIYILILCDTKKN
jgi:hypothetical protein